jgi:hypothetical protein
VTLALTASGCSANTLLPTPLTSLTTDAPNAAAIAVPSVTPPLQPPAACDYRTLLVQPEDLARPETGYTVPEPATLNPDNIPGAEVMLTSDDGTNAIGITVIILAEESAAPAELPQAVTHLKTVVSNQAPAPFKAGDEGYVVSGTTPDRTQTATALMYRYKRALIRIDFYTLPGQPTPESTLLDVSQKQTALIRVGLDATSSC